MSAVLFGDGMTRKRHSPAQIARLLKGISDEIAAGTSHQEAAVRAGVSEQTLRRWIRDYGEQDGAVTVRLKQLQGENQRLKKTLWKLERDNQVLSEAVRGNY
jgi:transposase-like protein